MRNLVEAVGKRKSGDPFSDRCRGDREQTFFTQNFKGKPRIVGL